ncbi:protein phosphatase CheZ [Arenibaculum pallidiluteum]|uniref:protein phosphatase CheZ n=1 Tax=Arenibaculum pallidiluteum TaxID=2812559 RepID=UPI001A96336C|nr:protein phosphatase CheZ [Arenibaculum pallidiluteum]
MSQAAFDPTLRARIDAARAEARQPLTRPEVAEIVASVLRSMEGDVSSMDLKLYAELESLARFIQHTRREIAAIRGEDSGNRIPNATDELDAVVGATEDATNRIMDSCDVVQAIAGRVGGDDGAQLVDAVTRIFEACNFQDVTGQRITKVVRTLKHIETRIEALVEALGDEVFKGGRPAPEEAPEGAASTDDERSLLNGPQLPGAGIDQSEIDRLLGGG